MGAELPVGIRARTRVYVRIYTYVYAVLSDGTRGCCGLIYRLSLPWKPRRDRLARHPHIRVDSGLLYSPSRLAFSISLPPSPTLVFAVSLSFSHDPTPHSLSLLISLSPPLFLSFSSPHSFYLSISLSYPPFLSLLLPLARAFILFLSLSLFLLRFREYVYISLYLLLFLTLSHSHPLTPFTS